MRYRAVVFDLGGVLLDSESAHEAAARRAAAQLGLQVPEQGWPRLRGGAYEDFFDYVLSLPGNSGCAVPPMEVVLLAYDLYHDEVRRSARLFDDALGSLQAARAAFRFVALATSSEWRLVETALRQFALAGLFDAVICGDHLTQRKPAPEVYLVTAWLLGVRPSGMVAVEDSAPGARAARRARAHTIGLATNCDAHALHAAGAHCVVRDHAQLTERLRSLGTAAEATG